MDEFRTRPEFLRGRNGERIIADLLMARGWYVIPSYDYSGEDGNKAPKMQGARSAFVLPDLDVIRQGKRFWCEVKTKKEPTYTRMLDRLEHGIPLRHYQHYRLVEEETGCFVWLFIYEELAAVVLCNSLNNLERFKRIYAGGKMSYGGMVFWPRDRFFEFRYLPKPSELLT